MHSSGRQKLVRGILDTSYLIKKQQEIILTQYGLNHSRFNVLQFLSNHPAEALTQFHIRERLTDKTIDLPRVLGKLLEDNLIDRYNDRHPKFNINEKGNETLLKIQQHSAMNFAVSDLTDEEVYQMNTLMQKITERLKRVA